MNTNQFFTTVLKLTSPWKVERVETDFETNCIHLYVWYDSLQWKDPKTDRVYTVYDRREERQWRHLDLMQYQTIIHCRIPRVKMPDGSLISCPVPWGDKNERHSHLFENKGIKVLEATHNQTQCGKLLNVSYEKVHRIMDIAVQRGLGRRDLERESVVQFAEKSYKKGHQDISVLSDSQGKRVLEVAKDRTQASGEALLEKTLSSEKLAKIRAVCVDMWEPFMAAVKKMPFG